MKRYKLTILLLLLVIPFSSMFMNNTSFVSAADGEHRLIVGITAGPTTLDPHNSWSWDDWYSIYQMMEGLYAINFSSPESEIIPQLASSLGTWSPDMLNLTVPLRSDVTFHDGSEFNATVVKWNFDRLIHHLVDLDDLSPENIYKVNDQIILNRCEIIDTHTVRFVLNFPNVVWESLLAESYTFIFKPDAAYWDTLISNSDIPIGTGPFKLDENDPTTSMNFSYYPDYYLGWHPNHIEILELKIIPDFVELGYEFLNYTVDFLPSMFSDFDDEVEADPYLSKTGRSKAAIEYSVSMNVENIPLDVRKACQFAWNYSYFLEDTLSNLHGELHSAIPDEVRYHHDDGAFVNGSYSGVWPHMNVVLARSHILTTTDPGLGANVSSSGLTAGSSNAAWVAIAESTTPLAWFNYTGYISGINTAVSSQLQENLKQIGIRIDINPFIDWNEWMTDYVLNAEDHKKLEFFFHGWGSDYTDPILMIEPIYQTGNTDNLMELSDPYLDWLINQTYSNTGTARRDLFYEIQEYLVSDVVPNFQILQQQHSGFAYHNQRISNIDHLQSVMGVYYFYPCVYSPYYHPSTPVVNAIDPNPNTSGMVHMDWVTDSYIDTYHIYRYATPITEINGSVNYLGSTSDSYWDDTLPEGVFYYAIMAENETGYSDLSNSVGVTVDIPGPDAPILDPLPTPDTDGTIILDWDDVSYADSYNVYRYISPITEVNGSLSVLGSPVISTWTDHVTLDITYYYAVDAVNGTGTSGLSNSEGVFIDLSGPDTPVLEPITSPSDGHVNLIWTNVDHADNYTVYRYTSPITSINGSITTLGIALSFFYPIFESESGLFYYAVRAQNETGWSGLSNTEYVVVTHSLTLQPITPNPSEDGTVNLNWEDVIGATSYTIYRSTSVITVIDGTVTNLGDVTESSYQDTGLSDGTYYYVVVANILEYSTPISNGQSVIVDIKKVPGFSIWSLLLATISIAGILLWKYKKKS